MSGIRGKHTRPEILIRRLLHRSGFRFRLHVKELPGKPDIVLPKYRAVVQVNGCFWHGHDCNLFKWPGTRREWWREKIERNRDKDEENRRALLEQGWRVAVVWECAIKGRTRLDPSSISDRLVGWLLSDGEDQVNIRGGSDGPGNTR